jgi:hypothetical protein
MMGKVSQEKGFFLQTKGVAERLPPCVMKLLDHELT